MGAIGSGLVEIARRSGGPRRGLASVALVVLVLFCGWQSRYSPLLVTYSEWTKADRVQARFFRTLEPTLLGARNGTTVKCPSVPLRVLGNDDGPAVGDVAVLTQRSVQAWTELRFPGRRFTVVGPSDPPKPRPNEVVVVFRKLKNVGAGSRPTEDQPAGEELDPVESLPPQ